MFSYSVHHYNPKPETDFSQLRTVSVVANFNTIGKFKPEYFRVVNSDQSEATFKIDAIKYTREYDNRILFCCLYSNHGKQLEVGLMFYINECVWVIV
jgi:thiamine pyrophosphokinase